MIPIDNVEGESSIVQDDEVSVVVEETEATNNRPKRLLSVKEDPATKPTVPASSPTLENQLLVAKKKQLWLVVIIVLLALSLAVLLIKHFDIRVSIGEDAPENIEEMDTIHKVTFDSIKSIL